MSAFNLEASIARAESRLRRSRRQARSDRGKTRAAPEVEAKLRGLLLQPDRPPMAEVERELRAFCLGRGARPLSRASLYNALGRLPVPTFEWASLPEAIRQSLYNLGEPSATSERGVDVPGDQIVFYAFNYGSTAAISFASGLPWLCLHRAVRRPGWRPKSRALLEAVVKYRGI
jgi:hypothetical protein